MKQKKLDNDLKEEYESKWSKYEDNDSFEDEIESDFEEWKIE